MIEPTPPLIVGLTTLGVIHTVISLLALAAGVIALAREGQISWANSIGKFYVVTTIIVCVTGFGIFQHGGFGKPHALGVITLLVLAAIWAARKKSNLFGGSTPTVVMVLYSLTFFFHIIPAITETATRLPLDAPLAPSPEDPNIKMAIGVCLVLFVIGAVLQVRRFRAHKKV